MRFTRLSVGKSGIERYRTHRHQRQSKFYRRRAYSIKNKAIDIPAILALGHRSYHVVVHGEVVNNSTKRLTVLRETRESEN